MAALTFYAFHAFREFCDITFVYVNSGFSIRKLFDHIGTKRRNYLFKKYCRESWENDEDDDDSVTLKLCNSSLTNNSRSCEISKTIINANVNANQQLTQACSNNRKLFFNQCLKIYQKQLIKDFQNIEKNKYNIKEMDSDSDDFCFFEGPTKLSEFMTAIDDFDSSPILEGQEVFEDTTYHSMTDEKIVFINDSLDELHEGTSFLITGIIAEYCEWFSINFKYKNETNDIALHVNPRLPQNYIVRNCRIKQIWGMEEVASGLAFSLHRGRKFNIEILLTEEEFYIAVNGYHFAAFRHRMPYNKIKLIEVKGHVNKVKCLQRDILSYPTRLIAPQLNIGRLSVLQSRHTLANVQRTKIRIRRMVLSNVDLSLPHYASMNEPFTVGKSIQIEGRIKLLPYAFYVNLQDGKNIWPHPVISFHLNPRFGKANVGRHVICRNSWFDGKWGPEERSEINTEFSPGREFTLTINCTEDAYVVLLNNSLICEYKFRIDPESVDTVYVHGDIKLYDISMFA